MPGVPAPASAPPQTHLPRGPLHSAPGLLDRDRRLEGCHVLEEVEPEWSAQAEEEVPDASIPQKCGEVTANQSSRVWPFGGRAMPADVKLPWRVFARSIDWSIASVSFLSTSRWYWVTRASLSLESLTCVPIQSDAPDRFVILGSGLALVPSLNLQRCSRTVPAGLPNSGSRRSRPIRRLIKQRRGHRQDLGARLLVLGELLHHLPGIEVHGKGEHQSQGHGDPPGVHREPLRYPRHERVEPLFERHSFSRRHVFRLEAPALEHGVKDGHQLLLLDERGPSPATRNYGGRVETSG